MNILRFFCLSIILFAASGCSRSESSVLAGEWSLEDTGTRITVKIFKQTESDGDSLTAKVNGTTTQYFGVFDGVYFIGTGTDRPFPRPREGRWVLAEVSRDGNLMCKLLNASQIPPGTILKKVK